MKLSIYMNIIVAINNNIANNDIFSNLKKPNSFILSLKIPKFIELLSIFFEFVFCNSDNFFNFYLSSLIVLDKELTKYFIHYTIFNISSSIS